MENQKTENLFSIQFVSNMTGINPHTIRAWEKRYGATKPVRDKNGRRLYSDNEVHRLTLLQQLVNQGNNISDIADLAIDELEGILSKYKLSGAQEVNHNDSKFDIHQSLTNILMSLNFFKLDVLSHELEKASLSLSGKRFINELIVPVISEVRKLKEENRLDTCKREQIYLILKSTLIKKMSENHTHNSDHKRITVAGAEGQLNELGAMAAAVLFQSIGLSIDFLGAHVGARAIAELNQHFKSDYIFIGLNYSHESSMSHRAKEEYIDKLAQNIDARTKVLIGAYDFCFRVPSENMQCFTDFDELTKFFGKTTH